MGKRQILYKNNRWRKKEKRQDGIIRTPLSILSSYFLSSLLWTLISSQVSGVTLSQKSEQAGTLLNPARYSTAKTYFQSQLSGNDEPRAFQIEYGISLSFPPRKLNYRCHGRSQNKGGRQCRRGKFAMHKSIHGRSE